MEPGVPRRAQLLQHIPTWAQVDPNSTYPYLPNIYQAELLSCAKPDQAVPSLLDLQPLETNRGESIKAGLYSYIVVVIHVVHM